MRIQEVENGKCPVALEGAVTCETEDTSRTSVFAVSKISCFLWQKMIVSVLENKN